MAITWTEDADSRQNLGPSGIIQSNTATFAANDYPAGGYPVVAAAFGMGRLRGMCAIAETGGALGYNWVFDSASNTLLAYNGITQAAAGTDFSNNGGSVKMLAFGY